MRDQAVHPAAGAAAETAKGIAPNFVVLGVDPGLAALGYGVIAVEGNRMTARTYGVLRTKRQPGLRIGTDLAKRVGALGRAFEVLVEEWRPDHAAIEEFRFYGRAVSSALQLANVTGMLREVLRAHGIPVAEYSARQIKHQVTRDGNADKKTVQEMVRRHLGLPTVPRPQHAADGLAAAIVHAGRLPMIRAGGT